MEDADLLALAIGYYHDLVASGDEAAQAQALTAELDRRKLFFGDRRVCTVLRPHFVTRGQVARAAQACRLLGTAFDRLGRAILEDERLQDALDLTPAERRLAAVDPGYRGLATTSRLDAFLTDELRFTEYNAESPAAVAYQDQMAEAFLAQPLLTRFQERYALEHLWIRPRLLQALMEDYREFGGRGTPTIAIVDWHDVPTRPEFELCREFFEAHGVPTIICAPADLAFSDGRLRHEDRDIDLVYKRVLTSELLEREGEQAALLLAYRAGAVCVCNSFRVKCLHKKGLFALLTDPRYQTLFSDGEVAAIHRHIPWTRMVREGWTTHGEETVDLVPFILDRQERLVLKPNDEYGGKGVVLGWAVEAGEWERAVTEALGGSYVVQERIPVPTVTFPRLGPPPALEPMSVDLDPYLIGGDLQGLLTRLAPMSAGLLNVTAGGGSAAPTFILEPRD